MTVSISADSIRALSACSSISSSLLQPRALVGDVDVFQFGVTFHGGHAQVASDAALLEAAERGFDMHAGMRIDTENAAFDIAGHAEGAFQVAGPDGTAQSIRAGVHLREHLSLVLKRP